MSFILAVQDAVQNAAKQPYFYFWGVILSVYGYFQYQEVKELRSIKAWLKAIAEDMAKQRLGDDTDFLR